MKPIDNDYPASPLNTYHHWMSQGHPYTDDSLRIGEAKYLQQDMAIAMDRLILNYERATGLKVQSVTLVSDPLDPASFNNVEIAVSLP